MRHNNWYDEPSGQSEIDFGFGPQNKVRSEPPSQILIPHSYKEELQKPKLCSQCSKPISFIPESSRWICYTCQLTWLKDFDTPLSSIENSIKPLQSNNPYEKESPAFISVKLDGRLQGENKYGNGIQGVRISGNGRIVKFRTTNLAAASEENIRKYLAEDAIYGL